MQLSRNPVGRGFLSEHLQYCVFRGSLAIRCDSADVAANLMLNLIQTKKRSHLLLS